MKPTSGASGFLGVFTGFEANGWLLPRLVDCTFSGGVGADFGQSPFTLGDGEADDGRHAEVTTTGAGFDTTPLLGSPIRGHEELLGCETTCSRFLFLMTVEPLPWLDSEQSGWVVLGTTQEECKVLIISGLSGVLEEVLTAEDEGERVSFRSSLLGGSP